MYGQNELYHWGILGMHWGVRRYQNKDGTLTPEGRARYRSSDETVQEAKDIIRSKRYNEDVSDEVFDTVGADKEKLNPIREELLNSIQEKKKITEDVNELFKELEQDDDKMSYYEAASEIAYDLMFYDSQGNDKPTAGQVASSVFMGCFEDGQQGPINAYSMYASDKGLSKEIEKLSDRTNKAQFGTTKACGKLVDEALKDIGNDSIKKYSNYETTGEAIVDSMIRRLEDNESWDKISGVYKVSDAEPMLNFGQQQKSYMQRAKKIANNLDRSDVNNWFYLNEAMDSLGLSNIPAEDLSKADWDRINAETKKLRISKEDKYKKGNIHKTFY